MPKQPKIYPLSSVTKALENLIEKYAGNYIWIKAEIVKLNHYTQSGHAYPDLVEKVNGKIIAEIRGIIWKDDFIKINKRFKEVLKEELGNDMTVVCLAKVKYSSVHGLSLNIIDINPEYTLGELARQKAETIKRLKTEQIFDLNKQKQLPLIAKTIAVISVETSKGYQDFINIINKNDWGYKFHCKLFPALLQGERSVASITTQLKNIKKHKDIFDAVAIIRGGGGDIGLSSYDNYELAKEVATYPTPVLSGIGHATNLTVTEMVSYQNFITPTKIAEFLIQKFHDFSVPLNENINAIERYSKRLFETNRISITETARLFNSLTDNYLNDQKHKLISISRQVTNQTNKLVTLEKNKLKEFSTSLRLSGEKTIHQEKIRMSDMIRYISIFYQNSLEKEKLNLGNIEKNLNILSPENILKRGFSITRVSGKSVSDISKLTKGEEIITQLAKGHITSTIKTLKKDE